MRGPAARNMLKWTAALAVLACGSPARAQPQGPSVWDRGWLFEADLGAGTPVGLVGAQIERRLGPAVAVRAGIGWNLLSVHGAGMLRIRIPDAPALNLGAGFSGGRFHPFCIWCSEEARPTWKLAFFNNYELSLETRAQTGFTFRFYLGWGWLMNTEAYECTECTEDLDPGQIPVGVPYTGIALGGAFD
jgi:hypothetical protein